MTELDIAPLGGYPADLGLLLAMLQDATNEWRGELSDTVVTADEVVWTARPGGPSIGAQMLHLISVEIWWLEEFVLSKPMSAEERQFFLWDTFDVDAGQWPVPPHQPLQWYFDLHDRLRARVYDSMRSCPPLDQFITGRTRRLSVRWVLGHVIQHEAYHGGQIVLLHNDYVARRVAE